MAWIKTHTGLIFGACFLGFALLFQILTMVTRINILKPIVLLGTFALAMAFAGNDLVNFIGVPIAALQSFQDWQGTGIPASEYTMESLSAAVRTPVMLLLLAGIIMVITLWFSSKARNVVKTSVDLSRQNQGEEKFQPNFLSRQVVKYSIRVFDKVNDIFPDSLQKKVNQQFAQTYDYSLTSKVKDLPAFDLVRAAVNLMVASVLISIATSMKLPLSTTYVTFMVAMGTSLADRAWGTESAVYRVAGVFNVIGGWFLTAIIAFSAAALVAVIIHFGGIIAVGFLLLFAAILITRNYLNHRKSNRLAKLEYGLKRAESSSIQGVIEESADNITSVIKRSNKIYTHAIFGLA